ncbi:MAG: Asp-tRNA(Asn)/Glu-tRNA(Gln) amidotransferase subunit GatC [Candidatus Omnitrophica bacterium]|nr:Asp-tRNA(Asn)/Glu-tRNA(Gln) amidotransferase subunit GatC [Candidatus Omnitrophota bacterium]
MAISKDTVKYVAHLARIKLTEEELNTFSGQLEEVLKYMEKLNKLDISSISPTSHILPIKNVYREDKIRPSLDTAAVLKNAIQKKDNHFSVPKVI